MVRYVPDADALLDAMLGIKLWACPHCGRIGTLNRHGLLRGYEERGDGRTLRGRRVFWSNRHRRPGCGRTFSVMLGSVVLGFVVRTLTLFRFVEAVVAGVKRAIAWREACGGAFSSWSGYRLWTRLSRAQHAVRTRLCREAPPPRSTHVEPLGALLDHLRLVLLGPMCPFSAFQVRFGMGLMG